MCRSTRPGFARPRLLATLLGAVLTMAAAGAVAHRYATDPRRVAEAFLRAGLERDYARLYRLMDRAFQQAVPPERGTALLAALNPAIPRDCSIVLSGYPSDPNGLVDDRHLFYFRVESVGPSRDRPWPAYFRLVLTQGKDTRWRVAFTPTYESLCYTLPAGPQAPDMGRMVAWAAGARTPWLQQWREWQ